MKRGTRGEGILEMQKWLIDLGYLDDKADGIFGKKTEAAVKAYQKSMKKKQTGTLTAAQADEIMYLWMDVTGDEASEEMVIKVVGEVIVTQVDRLVGAHPVGRVPDAVEPVCGLGEIHEVVMPLVPRQLPEGHERCCHEAAGK